jgi:hypothetical protein
VGELAWDSETRDSQDRPWVNPAGAGRKNGCLSREGCLCRQSNWLPLRQRSGMGRQQSAEAVVPVSSGSLRREGPNTEPQGPTERLVAE